jgi:hypothetical protein
VILTGFSLPPARKARVPLLGIGLAPAMPSALIVAGAHFPRLGHHQS